eukprot:GHVQ01023547.1.p1 GENE.GHVQ01023547.1~~GHVQ01023547.1.p1  ORF type:complete len:588 (+),score=109.96 GHVQ01023547.1:3961-5724(+)
MSPNNWFSRAWNILRRGYMCDMNVWVKSAENLYGDTTFLEAYEKTGKVLNICMTRADATDGDAGAPLVLNYKNAPNVVLYSAVLCSVSIPFFSYPLNLKEKTRDGQLVESVEFEGSFYHDGSLSGDIPINLLRDMWGITFTIVSQVNPHVFPFSGLRAHGEAGSPVTWRGRSGKWRAGFVLSALELFFKESMRFILRLVALLDVSPTYRGINCGALALQSYSGDVTVHPRSLSWRHARFANDLTKDEIDWYLQEGRVMTYPKMSLILNRMRIERALERIHLAAFEHLYASRLIDQQNNLAPQGVYSPVSFPGGGSTPSINPYSVVEQRTFKHISQLHHMASQRYTSAHSSQTRSPRVGGGEARHGASAANTHSTGKAGRSALAGNGHLAEGGRGGRDGGRGPVSCRAGGGGGGGGSRPVSRGRVEGGGPMDYTCSSSNKHSKNLRTSTTGGPPRQSFFTSNARSGRSNGTPVAALPYSKGERGGDDSSDSQEGRREGHRRGGMGKRGGARNMDEEGFSRGRAKDNGQHEAETRGWDEGRVMVVERDGAAANQHQRRREKARKAAGGGDDLGGMAPSKTHVSSGWDDV